jgi:uncharacterized protein (DUF2345 family)
MTWWDDLVAELRRVAEAVAQAAVDLAEDVAAAATDAATAITDAAQQVAAADWLDRRAIRDRARTAAGGSDRLGEPTLSYLKSRDRLAWRVPITNRPVAIYVSGEHVEVVRA